MATTEIDPLQGFQQALEGLAESMCLDAAKLAAQRIPESQFLAFRQWVADDEPKRRELAASLAVAREEAAADVRAEIMDQIEEVAPELVKRPVASEGPRPWADWHPLKPETHFFYGDECLADDGRVYISRRDPTGKQPNVHAPTAPGTYDLWEEKLPEPEAPAEPPEDTTELADAVPGVPSGDTPPEPEPETEPGPEPYTLGERDWKENTLVTFEGATYRCKTSHRAGADWTPVNAWAYWEKQ